MIKYKDFSEEQKNEFASMGKRLVELSVRSRREGILALEDGLEEIKTEIPTKGGYLLFILIRLMVDGNEDFVISDIADNCAAASGENAFDEFLFKMVKEGVLSIQRGDNPRVLEMRLLSYAGFDCEEDFCKRSGLHSWNDITW